MKKRKSKGLAFLVAVAVAFSLLPGVAFAQPVGTAEDLEAALETGGEVTLSASIELAAGTQFDIENAVTLDLNGFSITRAGDSSSKLFSVKNNGSLTLNDSKGGGAIQSTYPVQLWSNSAFIMNGGDITSSRGAALDIYTGASNVKVEISGGSLEAGADNTFGIRGSENVVVDIKGGEILSQTNRLAIYVSGAKDNAIQLNISGGSIQNEGQAIQAYSGAVVNVSGSANIHSETGTAISTQSGYGAVELNILGGNISTASRTGYAVQAREESKVNISGGTIEGGTAVQVSDSATVSVNGGTLEGKRAAIAQSSGATPNITVTTGKFSHSVEDYLADDSTMKQNPDGSFTVAKHYVAQIGNTQYTSLEEAVAVAGKNGVGTEIVLLESVADVGQIPIDGGRTITIDLAGFDIGFASTTSSQTSGMFLVQNGTLNLEGKGRIYEQAPYYAPVMLRGSANSTDENYSVVNVGSEVTLEGWSGLFLNQTAGNQNYGMVANVYGTLNSVKDSTGAGGHTLYLNGSVSNTEGAVPRITLDGAKLTNKEGGNGIYLAGYAETVIKNSTITSNVEGSTGIEIRAGKLEISNSTVVGGNGTYGSIADGNGATSRNVALAIAQHTTKLPVEVTVGEGTVLRAGTAFAQADPQKNGEEAVAKVSAAITGGTFYGDILAENLQNFITNGSFDRQIDNDYIVPGAVIATEPNGDGLYVIHTHSYSSAWSFNADSHWKECACGDRSNEAAHTFSWVIDKAATETEAGSRHEECTVCGYAKAAETIPATGATQTPAPSEPAPSGPPNQGSGTADAPKTGDDANFVLYLALMVVAIAAVVGIAVYRRKRMSAK